MKAGVSAPKPRLPHLLLSSPPYMLRNPRAYGNPPDEDSYIDFICRVIEPVVRTLVPGGSIALNVSNDQFMSKSPARSMVIERLMLALNSRLGLQLMDSLVWHNPSKAPGPIQWASLQRSQLNTGYERVLWFTNDPLMVRSDNRRVLQPHSERHKKLIAKGGENRTCSFGDGAYRLRPGSFGKPTEGKIPRNVLTGGHRCPSLDKARSAATSVGLPVHGALMPLWLADFLVRFLTQPDDLVVDTFGGWGTTALAAEQNGRRWIVGELMKEHVQGAASRFESAPGFEDYCRVKDLFSQPTISC